MHIISFGPSSMYVCNVCVFSSILADPFDCRFSLPKVIFHANVLFVYSCVDSIGLSGNWIEIAYGTRSGSVRVIVQHPETVGHGPQLFQTFTVHQSPVTKVTLSEKFLISVCSEYNHVRTWQVPRFRGMISTQPGSTPEASFKVKSI